jgi:hypothetical protein
MNEPRVWYAVFEYSDDSMQILRNERVALVSGIYL